MEYLDILDEQGNKTGEVRSKKEAHDKGLWHKSVHVWVINSKGEILMQRRSPLVDNHPNEWDISAAGHVSAGEEDITSAIRETEEEIGVTLNPEDFKLLGVVKQQSSRPGYINNEINPIYLVKIDKMAKEFKRQEEEVAELKWISIDELKQWYREKKPDLCSHPEEFELLFKNL